MKRVGGKRLWCGSIAILGLVASGATYATLLLPGSGPLPIDTLARAPGGTVLASTTATLSAPNWTATGRFAVVQSQPGGTLDFYYQIANASSSSNELGRVTGSEFLPAFTTNLFQTASASLGIFTAGTQAATNGDRGSHGVVGFNFFPGASGTGEIGPGEPSDTLIIRTNAAAFEPGFVGAIGAGGTFTAGYEPSGSPILVGPIPEPGTLALLASGLLAFAGIVRQRMR